MSIFRYVSITTIVCGVCGSTIVLYIVMSTIHLYTQAYALVS